MNEINGNVFFTVLIIYKLYCTRNIMQDPRLTDFLSAQQLQVSSIILLYKPSSPLQVPIFSPLMTVMRFAVDLTWILVVCKQLKNHLIYHCPLSRHEGTLGASHGRAWRQWISHIKPCACHVVFNYLISEHEIIKSI